MLTCPTSSETEDAYNEWYNDKHLVEVARLEGVVRASRYKFAHEVALRPGTPAPTQRYLAIYELAGRTIPELRAFADSLVQALDDGRVSIDPSLDVDNMISMVATPFGASVSAD